MTEFAEAPDLPERGPRDEDAAPAEDQVAEPAAQPQDAPAPEQAGDQSPVVAEPETQAVDECGPAVAAAEAQQSSQGFLFGGDVPPATAPEPGDEGVTSFGGQPDDLAAIRADLESDEPAEQPVEVQPVDAGEQVEVVTPEAAEEAETQAETEAEAAVTEAGVPEGSDDDVDAVEALLDAETAAGLLEPERDRILSAPFLAYDGVWLLFSVAMVVALRGAAVADKLDTDPSYPLFVLVGLVLTVLGPILALFLWWMKRSKTPKEERGGLLSVALLRGALATFAGVVMWWIALVVLNYFKTGRFF